MKVFDFTNGKRGELLGDIRRPGYMSGWLVSKGNKVFKIELAGKHGGGDWAWQSEAGYGFRNTPGHALIRPEDFGVSAICFCTGSWRCDGKDVWQWAVVGTDDWNRKAVRCGILNYSVERILTDEEMAENQAAQAA